MSGNNDPWSPGANRAPPPVEPRKIEDDLFDARNSSPGEEVKAAGKPERRRTVGMPGWLKLLGYAFGACALVMVGVAGYAAWYVHKVSKDLPNYQVLAQYAPPVTTRVYAGDGTLVAEFARERRLFVPIGAIPDKVKYAFVSAEDKNFFEHSGLDYRGILRAGIADIGNIIRGRRLESGSTITQQVAKNFLLSSEQKIERKVREMLVTLRMEKAFTKDHILELYLNEIYLGNRSYGVAAAALNYFGKSLDDLTIAQAAFLATLPKGPGNYNPAVHHDRAVKRRNWVIGRMLEDGRITAEEAEQAKAEPLVAKVAPPLGARDWASEYFAEEVRKQIADMYGVGALYDGGLAVRTTLDPHLQKVASLALRKWLVAYDERHGWRGPIANITVDDNWAETLDDEVQKLDGEHKMAEDLSPWLGSVVLDVSSKEAKIGFQDGSTGYIPLDQMQWARAYKSANALGDDVTAATQVLHKGDVIYAEPARNADGKLIEGVYALRQIPAVNGAMVAIDPHTGRVLAMVGGFSFELSEFNRALQAQRQPGSAFKPFVYAAALDSGYTPSSIVLDAPFVAPGVDSWWKPGNYVAGRFYGESTLRVGIEQSRNTMTARLAQDLGIGRIVEYASRFHVSDNLPRELAISLGAAETTVMKITAAYSTFVNGGKRVEPVLIDRVQDRTGKTIYKRDGRRCPDCDAAEWDGQAEPQLADAREQIMDPRTAYQIVSLLEGVVQRGTGSQVKKRVDKPVAGKTGTTNEYKDAWFVGFSPDLAAGVYVGFDMPQTLGQGEAGGVVAAPIFGDFMAAALKDKSAIPFRVPSGIKLVRVNAKTGKPAQPGDRNVILEAFKAGDVISQGPSADDLDLDPLSKAPKAPASEPSSSQDNNLNGLY